MTKEHWAEEGGGAGQGVSRIGAQSGAEALRPGPRLGRGSTCSVTGKAARLCRRPGRALGGGRAPCGARSIRSIRHLSRRSRCEAPVILVTGFLGSGKTTLLSRTARRPELGETAVIVNELGEVGLDHHLLRRVDERTVLLASGCVCCTCGATCRRTPRPARPLGRGRDPTFRRVVVETTGVAVPTPIVHTLLTDPLLPHHYSLDGVVATIDGQHGLRGMEALSRRRPRTCSS